MYGCCKQKHQIKFPVYKMYNIYIEYYGIRILLSCV